MRVLLTCHVRFASAMAWYTLHLARGLKKAGHEVYLSSQRGSPLAEWSAKHDIPGSSEHDFHSPNPVEICRSISKLSSAIRSFRPDILNPHCPPGHALLAIASHGRLPIVRTVAEPRSPKRHIANKLLHEKLTHGIIYSTSSSLPRYLKAFDLTGVFHEVIHPGLDLEMFPPVAAGGYRSALGINSECTFAAIIARMSPEKGQELAISALARLTPHERSQIAVLLTGDDSKERTAADLRNLAIQKGTIECLHFLPRLEDVRPLLSEIDVGIITSIRSEAVCRVALEYMAYSKPIISTDVNILSEVVRDGVNGWNFPVNNIEGMAHALREAIANSVLRRKLGDAGRALLEREFTLESMVENTIEHYKRVIALRNSA